MDEIKKVNGAKPLQTWFICGSWATAHADREVSRLNIRVSKPGKYVQHLYN